MQNKENKYIQVEKVNEDYNDEKEEDVLQVNGILLPILLLLPSAIVVSRFDVDGVAMSLLLV